jgi:serine/threonine protein kinase
VLLDEDNVPKLGDFGLVKMGPQHDSSVTSCDTQVVIGTSAYMPPEAHDFQVSVKYDIYSYGVVSLFCLLLLLYYNQWGYSMCDQFYASNMTSSHLVIFVELIVL